MATAVGKLACDGVALKKAITDVIRGLL